jgi:hypothetical protein
LRWQLGPVLFFVVLGILIALVFVVVDAVSGEVGPPASPTPREVELQAQRDRARRYADRLERILRREISRAEKHERALSLSRSKNARDFRRALGTSPIGNHWLESAFQCIHQHEGRWSDPGYPYYGGLQMDLDFQRAYGHDFLSHFGPANHWPRSVQLAVAIRGWLRRGFQPWPNTARMCGLR